MIIKTNNFTILLRRILTLSLLVTCFCACESVPLAGRERWEQFVELAPDEEHSWKPSISSHRGVYPAGAEIRLNVEAPEDQFYYVFLMLPNNDVYLLTPSTKIPNHSGTELVLLPQGSRREIFAPRVYGEYFVGVIASPQNLSVVSEGWVQSDSTREFDTWPANLPFSTALSFIETAFEDKPWSHNSTSFTVERPE